MNTGRKDSSESYASVIDLFIPNHNDSTSSVLSRFQSIGIDPEGAVALLGTLIYYYTRDCIIFLMIFFISIAYLGAKG